jgi:hypothetical protein
MAVAFMTATLVPEESTVTILLQPDLPENVKRDTTAQLLPTSMIRCQQPTFVQVVIIVLQTVQTL